MGMTRRRFLQKTLAAGVGLAAGVRAQRDALRIGVVLPYSGVYAQLGEDITNGMLLYFEERKNLAGGRPIQLIREDETADPSVALRKLTKLVEQDRVDLLTGLVSTASAYAVRDFVHNTRNVLLVSNAGGNALTRERKSPYIFRTSFTSWQVSFPLGRWVAERVTKRVAVVAADYAFGRESVAAFKESFLAAGGEVVQETYTPLGSTDFSAAIARLLQARPGAVYGFLAGSDAAIFLRQYAQFGLKGNVPLTTTGFTVEEDVIQAVGAAAEGAYSSLHWAVRLAIPENQRFVQAYQRRFGRSPSVYAVQGYDTARVIVEAVNALQGDVSNKSRLVEALEGVRFRGPRGLFEFDPKTHHVIQNIYVRQVRNVGGELANVVVADLGKVRDPG
ncbi:ABC transporter substrate-binding protein [Thermus scotoductus]|uniref:ABC transporter substrate-binding protein n=2 Tax=Thermus scotoductus TaxID=37636 RepID=A0A430RQQ0_THESC|nr:ABC transporter substrate-binding protein [Thermus scotoductus]RTI40548.1 ABC transporter substrate-binding protein [Thermus scotoductus]